MARPTVSLGACCLAELLGTFLLVFFGCGAVHAAVLTSAQSGLWQVAIVWGVAVTVSVFVFAGISGAHINPAITVALAAWGDFPAGRVLPYIASQVAGGFLAGALLFVLYGPQLKAHEDKLKVERGKAGSELTATCYGEYFPNPGGPAPRASAYIKQQTDQLEEIVSWRTAILAELVGTMILALVVFALTDPDNRAAPSANLAPVFVGLTVAILISVIAPLTQACFNPARDFGPRLFAATLGGWGPVAIPGPNGIHFLTVYVVAPIVGAVLGGGLYQKVLKRCLPPANATPERTTDANPPG